MSVRKTNPRRPASMPARLDACGTGWRLSVSGRPLILLAGELHNSGASSLRYVEPLLDRAVELNLNTILAPVSWDLLEPEEGRFDFTLVDGLIERLRARGLYWVPLWFGTMKNACACYVPAWVKTDLRRFPRVQTRPGESGWACSLFHDAIRQCDVRAFTALMRRLAARGRGTVVMVQVENEPGLLGAPRDLAPAAAAAFAGAVPAALTRHLAAHRATLAPALREAWEQAGARAAGPWPDVFGASSDEVFMAWHVARFVDEVAAAGRTVCDLPMFANAWLSAGPGYLPGQYPSGGPVAGMLDVWQAAAPHLDCLAPDIYQADFRAHCAAYHRPDNPLLIPEALGTPAAAANALYAIGRHHALGFSPFGIENLAPGHPLAAVYSQLAPMLPRLAEAYGTPRLTGFLQQADDERWTAELGAYRFQVRCARKLAACSVPGAALVLQVNEHEFVAVGQNIIITFDPLASGLRTGELVWVDEGRYVRGRWQPTRRLNGDETCHSTGICLKDELSMQRFRLHAYA